MNAMDRFRRECTAFFEALEAGAQKPLVFGDVRRTDRCSCW